MSSAPIAYKIIQVAAIVLFCVFISDRRRKPGMKPLIDERITLFTKYCYPVPILVWTYVVVMLETVRLPEVIALLLSLAGVAVTVKAKIDLADKHAWAGYVIEGVLPVSRGIYRYLKHPMYCGIAAVIVAGSLVISSRIPLWMMAAVTLINIWILAFLAVVARRETLHLAQEAFAGEAKRPETVLQNGKG